MTRRTPLTCLAIAAGSATGAFAPDAIGIADPSPRGGASGATTPIEFEPGPSIQIGTGLRCLLTGDLTGDGLVDLVVTRTPPGDDEIAVLLNSGSGTSVLKTSVPVGNGDLDRFATAFIDADITADIASPRGSLDLADIVAFVASFNAGCP